MAKTTSYLRVAAFVVFFLALVTSVEMFGGRPGYYPNVVVEVPSDLRLVFLREAYPERFTCESTASSIANAILASCPSCKITAQQCMTRLKPDQQRLLSSEPLDLPSARTADGVIVYSSGAAETATTACTEAERQTASKGRYQAKCFLPNTQRPVADWTEGALGARPSFLPGLLVILLSCMTAAFASFLIVRYDALHSRWSVDPLDGRPQKFHSVPTPRIGGLCLMLGLFVAHVALIATGPRFDQEQFGYLLLAGLPAFLVGITEDVTKTVSVDIRLAVTMLAASLGAWLLNGIVPRIDVPGADQLFRWMPLAIAFTIFAVAGVANAINIIDGYNGLAGGFGLIALAGLAYVAHSVDDGFVFLSSLGMIGALLGFLAFNYPKGRIFLGDSGAYLLGFWIAELAVVLVARHPQVSPWFPLSLLIYPVFETIFSIYRRKVIHGKSPGHPDRLHMHQIIYMRLIRRFVAADEPDMVTRSNSRVAPYIWCVSAVFCMLSVAAWDRTAWLVVLSSVFCVAYVWFYSQIVRWRSPGWLVRRH